MWFPPALRRCQQGGHKKTPLNSQDSPERRGRELNTVSNVVVDHILFEAEVRQRMILCHLPICFALEQQFVHSCYCVFVDPCDEACGWTTFQCAEGVHKLMKDPNQNAFLRINWSRGHVHLPDAPPTSTVSAPPPNAPLQTRQEQTCSCASFGSPGHSSESCPQCYPL